MPRRLAPAAAEAIRVHHAAPSAFSTRRGSNLSRGRVPRPRRTAPSRSAFSYTHARETPKRLAISAADTRACASDRRALEEQLGDAARNRLDGAVVEQRLAASAALLVRLIERVHTP